MRRVLGTATVAAGLLAATLSWAAPASADVDDRAEFHQGNATTCEDASLEGDILELVAGEHYTITDDTYVNIISIPDGFTITGTVVKGGNDAYIYRGDPVEDMRSPDNDGGQVPTISHWFLCATDAPPTTPPGTTPPTTEPPSEEPPTEEPTEEPDGMGGGDSTDEPVPDTGETLPDTGSSNTALLGLAGVGLLGFGALALRRRFNA